MDVVVENVSELRRKLTITVPQDEVRKELDQAYTKLGSEAKLKGFRRGKIPRAILEKTYKDKVDIQVAEQLVQATYFDAIEQEKIDAIAHPEIASHTINEDGTMTYVAEVDTKPTVELKEYKGLTIEKASTDISDIEIDLEIQKLRRENAVLKHAEEGHTVENDDIAVVDFQGFHNDKAMPEVHNEDFSVDVGTGSLGPEFEEKIIGMKKGDKTLHEINFPAEYPNPVLAGKNIEFKIDVKEIKTRILPEVDDEFAKDISEEHTCLDDLKASVKKQLMKVKEETQQGDLNDQLMHKLLDNHQFEVPKRLVAYEIEDSIKQYEETLKRSNLTLEAVGIKRDDLIEKNQEHAEKRVRGDFLIKKIAEVEEIKVESEDIERGYQRIAEQYNMTLAEVKKFFVRREETMPFIQELLNEKVLEFLLSQANITEKVVETPAPAED
ncbi:MAG: trigger factor [Desulfobulbaceae bacterium]|nr:trigger factor [Desulfobulbaceae bacterium]